MRVKIKNSGVDINGNNIENMRGDLIGWEMSIDNLYYCRSYDDNVLVRLDNGREVIIKWGFIKK